MGITRDEARDLWRAAGIRNEDLAPAALAALRDHVNQAMINCRSGERSLRASPAFREEVPDNGRGTIYRLDCTATWFGADQEAISIHPDGFIGFGGWAGEHNVQPILEGFSAWVAEMEATRANEASDNDSPEP